MRRSKETLLEKSFLTPRFPSRDFLSLCSDNAASTRMTLSLHEAMSSLSTPAQIFRGKRAPFFLLFPLTLAVLVFLRTPWLSAPRTSLTPDSLPQRPYPPPVGDRLQTSETSAADSASSTEPCRSLPGAEDVLIVVKTGASEIYEKLPEHLLTLLRCAPNYLIFSDVEQNIGNHHVYDVLTGVREHIKDSKSEFEYYREINRLAADGQSVAKLNSQEAWNLDKWKFLPMVRKAYQMRRTAKWFLFIEGDTAVVWANLVQWLKRLNPDKLIYSGSQNSLGDVGFAHGGSGILLSRAAVRKLHDNYASHEAQWENATMESCCGDAVLAQALLDVGVELTGGFPMIQGEAPLTVDWNPRHMCTPSVTWHHVSPMDIDMLWRLQQNWTSVNVCARFCLLSCR
jgi:hypothetical protein